MTDNPPSRRFAVLLAVAFEGGLLVLALGLGWLVKEPPLAQLVGRWGDLGLGLAASLPLVLGLGLCVRWPIGPLGKIKQFSEEVIVPIFRGCTVADLALISLLAGLGEEFLFRGVIQGSLDRRFGVGIGLAIASVLFGLVHLVTWTYAVLAGLIGLYFGLLVYFTDNLLTAIVPHALYDFIALVYLTRRRPQDAVAQVSEEQKNGESS